MDFEHIAMKHFHPTLVKALVTNDTTVRIVLVLMLVANQMSHINDMKGVLLKGQFEDKEIYMEWLQGMGQHYWKMAALKLLKPIYR